MEINILKQDGSDSGRKIVLNEAIFGIEPNDTVIYEDIRSYLANQRQGTAKVKGRSEVRGGGKKAFRQKGTGGARRGSLRSPLLPGGGTSHGPQPRDYVVRLNRKARNLARKSALSYKIKDNKIVVVEDLSFTAPKTADLLAVLKSLNLSDNKVLILTPGTDRNVFKSGRNLKKVAVLEANKPSTYEIVNAGTVVLLESALPVLETSLTLETKEA
ncbi:MAG: 50S ribosomal protein L4 [Bacteroidetes bacterium]|nr:50S ribosomal protein L4 [Bacteroidota bacterium]